MLATGGSASAAVDVLKDAGASEAHIQCVCIIGCPEGVRNFEERFPQARLVVGTIDERLNADNFIIPGLGDFGDRYCGTE